MGNLEESPWLNIVKPAKQIILTNTMPNGCVFEWMYNPLFDNSRDLTSYQHVNKDLRLAEYLLKCIREKDWYEFTRTVADDLSDEHWIYESIKDYVFAWNPTSYMLLDFLYRKGIL